MSLFTSQASGEEDLGAKIGGDAGGDDHCGDQRS